MDPDNSIPQSSSSNSELPVLPSTGTPLPQPNYLLKKFSNSNKKKLFIFLLAGILIIFFSISTIVYIKSKTSDTKKSKLSPTLSYKNNKQSSYDEWNTYNNAKYSLSFKYPKEMKFYEDPRKDYLLLLIDTDENQFSVRRETASISAEIIKYEKDPEQFQKKMADGINKIWNTKIFGPYIEVEVVNKYPTYTEQAFKDIKGEQKKVTINNIPALQKSGYRIYINNLISTPVPVQRKTIITVFTKDKKAYKFTYSGHPKRPDYSTIYDKILNSFTFTPQQIIPTNPKLDIDLPITNPNPTFSLEGLRTWEDSLKLADEKATAWDSNAKIYQISAVTTDNQYTNYSFYYTSTLKNEVKTVYVHPNSVQENVTPISDPEVFTVIDRKPRYFSPGEAFYRALQSLTRQEESEISYISAMLSEMNYDPEQPMTDQIPFQHWVIGFYNKNDMSSISKPLVVKVDLTGKVIYKK